MALTAADWHGLLGRRFRGYLPFKKTSKHLFLPRHSRGNSVFHLNADPALPDPHSSGSLSSPCRITVLLVSESQLVQVHGVWRLLGISVHLIVDGYAPPIGWRGTRVIGPVEVAGDTVEGDGLVGELIA